MADNILPQNSKDEGQKDEYDHEISMITNELMLQESDEKYAFQKEVDYNTPKAPTKEIKKKAILLAHSKIQARNLCNVSPVKIHLNEDDENLNEIPLNDFHPNDPNEDDENDLKMTDQISSTKSTTNIGHEGMIFLYTMHTF